MRKPLLYVIFISLALAFIGCKECKKSDAETQAAIEAAENAIHYYNVFGIRNLAMDGVLLDDWSDRAAISKVTSENTYNLAILDSPPVGKPAVKHIPNGWDRLPYNAIFCEWLTGQDLLSKHEMLIERGDGTKWGKMEVLAGIEIEENTLMENSWVVPFVFVHEQIVAPLAGSGSIYRIDVVLDSELKLITIIASGGQTWIS